MQQPELILYVIKLVLGGVAAFFAIMLWSKTRDTAWMSLVAGTVTSYAGIVYDLMCRLGIIVPGGLVVREIPVATMFFAAIPPLFFIVAFILMLIRTRK
ncbi:hypothetical protein [Treponema brennaborense]|uniref:Uncharacterized protein n=1 Tax=Treponema brennaborense (strain DSM 12168 / CIP 105900 / DD5/3) TaxID=906968 RepID=F4LKG3_TREBD|nr:hypothetical protein [Treponema brennaborense]AEE16537.1 hypothetical protein Trebr_1105 [Treponema brennaborense DSM 12168]